MGRRPRPRSFADIAFTPAVKAAQARRGSRSHNDELTRQGRGRTAITADLAAFLAGCRSFFIGTASADGQPYIQHRGGPPGFIRPLDEQTLGFPDFGGNRQYITIGNLADNPRAFIFIPDYSARQRVKIWGRAEIVEDDPGLIERLTPARYPAHPQRVVLFHVAAWDINCPQHIPQLLALDDVEAASAWMRKRIAELEQEVERLNGKRPRPRAS